MRYRGYDLSGLLDFDRLDDTLDVKVPRDPVFMHDLRYFRGHSFLSIKSFFPRMHQAVPDQLHRAVLGNSSIQTHQAVPGTSFPRQAAPCQESPSSTAPACVMGSFPQPPYHEPVFWISCPGHHYFVYERKGCIVFKKIRILTNRIVKDQISRSSVFSY